MRARIPPQLVDYKWVARNLVGFFFCRSSSVMPVAGFPPTLRIARCVKRLRGDEQKAADLAGDDTIEAKGKCDHRPPRSALRAFPWRVRRRSKARAKRLLARGGHRIGHNAPIETTTLKPGLLPVIHQAGSEVAGVEGLEPPTCWFEARRSIQLSYTPAEVIPS